MDTNTYINWEALAELPPLERIEVMQNLVEQLREKCLEGASQVIDLLWRERVPHTLKPTQG